MAFQMNRAIPKRSSTVRGLARRLRNDRTCALSESSLDSEESEAFAARLGEAPWSLEEAV
jgi:hypothetical protein